MSRVVKLWAAAVQIVTIDQAAMLKMTQYLTGKTMSA